MNRKPRFSPEALSHLDELEEHLIGGFGADVADNYLNRLLDFCDGIAAQPVAGHHRDDLVPGLRTRIFEKRRVVCFLVLAEEVHIVAIFGTGQAWEQRLRDEPPAPTSSR